MSSGMSALEASLAGSGMREAESRGVQSLPGEVERRTAQRLIHGFGRRGHAADIDRIAHDRVTARGEVNADLVRPPGRQAAFQQAGWFPRPGGAVAGQCRLAAVADNRHPLAVLLVAADGALDLTAGGDGRPQISAT